MVAAAGVALAEAPGWPGGMCLERLDHVRVAGRAQRSGDVRGAEPKHVPTASLAASGTRGTRGTRGILAIAVVGVVVIGSIAAAAAAFFVDAEKHSVGGASHGLSAGRPPFLVVQHSRLHSSHR